MKKGITLSDNALTVLAKRYLTRDASGRPIETPEDMFRRVAKTIDSVETSSVSHAEDYYRMMTSLDFMPNSPTLMNAGRDLGQLSACFVLPVGDSMEEIFDAIKYAALVHKSGGGTGFSFSRIRPSNDEVKTTSGVSSGPISFMRVFDSATETIKQGGTRRGANMGILRVDHPDIMDFISCKKDQGQLNNFNISVGLTEAFMEAVDKGEDYNLINPRTNDIAGQLNAKEVFQSVVDLAWTNGEPGIVFLDRMNRDNPTPHVGEIESTNPCGEQPLLPYESCNLGSINLANMVKEKAIDWQHLGATVQRAVRFLDNVIEANKYPLPQISEMTRANRKIGLGVMGWADMLIKLGFAYNSSEAVELGEDIMAFIQEECYAATTNLAEERGHFPNFPGSKLEKDGKAPMRNATCTTIAPTGTISIIANCSSGIEPLFAVSYIRQVMDDNKLIEVHPLFEQVAKDRGFYSEELMEKIAKKGTIQGIEEIPEDVRKVFVTSHDISPEDHIRMQAAFQKFTDNAVSKTVNFCHDATAEDVEKVYRLAFETGCKGVTIYRDGSRDQQVLSVAGDKDKKEVAAKVVPLDVPKKDVKRVRPAALTGSTYQMETGCGPLYITINEDEKGLFEVFTTMGKAGGCAASQCEAMGRLISMTWRSGLGAEGVIKQLSGISCHKPAGFGPNKITSCADAVAKAIETHIGAKGIEVEKENANHIGGACPECGGVMEHEGGCAVCHACFYSECS